MNARAYDTGALLILNAADRMVDDRTIDVKRNPTESCIIANAGTMNLKVDGNMLFNGIVSPRKLSVQLQE
jgi:hypothetical protein